MTAATPAAAMSAPTESLDRLAAALETTLRGQLDAHRELLPRLEQKRDALRRADLEGLRQSGDGERAIVRRLDILERQREALLGRLAAVLAIDGACTISAVASAVGDPAGRRLLALAGELRPIVEHARRESGVLRSAAESLVQHINGMIQTVHGALSAAGVYGRAGRVACGVQLQSVVDLRT